MIKKIIRSWTAIYLSGLLLSGLAYADQSNKVKIMGASTVDAKSSAAAEKGDSYCYRTVQPGSLLKKLVCKSRGQNLSNEVQKEDNKYGAKKQITYSDTH